MPQETGPLIVNFEDAELVGAALDSFIEHQRQVDTNSETTDVSASAAIRRAADARQQMEEDFLADLAPEVRSAAALGSTVLRGMSADEFAEALRNYEKTLPLNSEEATRAADLARQYEP